MAEDYSKALECMQKADSMPRGDARQDMYIKSRRGFEQAQSFVETCQLFSDNETIDDIATVDLKYLLIPAYLAKIAISSECGLNRLQTFKRADILLREFLQTTSKYGLCDKHIEEVIHGKSSDDDKRTSIASINSDPMRVLESAVQSRAEKIESFKKMKHLDDRINHLEQLINSGQQVEEETVREYYMKLIKRWISTSFDDLQNNVKPALLFEERNKGGQTLEERPIATEKSYKPFTIVRNELQKQVFGLGYPSHPTVTVNEFIDEKFKNKELSFQTQKGVYSNSLQRYAEKPNLLKEQEEQSDIEHDEKEDREDVEELQRKRNWDEFKDNNPRGSGNRHNMG